MVHELKTYPEYFEAVQSGKKPFEVRKNDRPFAVGDYLALNEYDPGENENCPSPGYTGRALLAEITYILSTEEFCKPGFVILGISLCEIVRKKPHF